MLFRSAEEVAKREAAGITVDAAMRMAIEKAALEAAPAALGRAVGSTTGALVGSAAQNMPETFNTIFTETGEMRPEVALLVGGMKSALDAFTPLQLLKKTRGVDMSDKLSDLITGRILKGYPGAGGAVGGLLETSAMEGLTEGAQELLDQMAVSYLSNKSLDAHKVAEAFLKGAIGGGAAGAAAGFSGGRARAREQGKLAGMAEEQRAEEQRQVELAQRYAELGTQAPATLSPREMAIIEARSSFPGITIKDDGTIDMEAAEKKIEETIKPSERKKALRDLRKAEVALADILFERERAIKGEGEARVRQEQETQQRRQQEQEALKRDEEILARGQQDPTLMQDEKFRGEFLDAQRRRDARTQAQRREEAQRQRELDELTGEWRPEDEVKPPAPTGIQRIPEQARTTLLDAGYRLDQIAKMTPEGAEQVASSLQREGTLYGAEEPTKLLLSERQVVEDLIREQPRNAPIPLDILQQRLAEQGRDVTLPQARDILSQYVEKKAPLPTKKGTPEYPTKPGKGFEGPLNVAQDVRLTEEDGQFSKVGARKKKAAPQGQIGRAHV